MNNRKKELLFICLIITFVVICFLSACTPQKKIAKQLDRNNALEAKLKEIEFYKCNNCINEYLTNNPCLPQAAYDLDSLCKANSNTVVLYDTVIVDKYNTTPKYIPQNIPKKIAVPYLDVRDLNRYKDSLTAYRDRVKADAVVISINKAEIEIFKKTAFDIDKLKKKINVKSNFLWFFGGLSLILLIIAYMLIRLLIKRRNN